MKCFNHQERNAVACCKHCGKGLCQECLVELPRGISCRGACEEQVAIVDALLNRARTTLEKTSRVHLRSAIFTGLAGLAFIAFGAITEVESLRVFLLVIGLVCIIATVLYYRSAKEFRRE